MSKARSENIVVKFRSGRAPGNPRGDGGTSEAQALQWKRLSDSFGPMDLQPRFTAIPADEIALLESEGNKSGEPKAGSLNDYFIVAVPEGADLRAMLESILALPDVETAFIEPVPSDPVVAPNDDPRFPNQGYLRAAPGGIDAVYAWTLAGGDGAGQHVADVEQGWTFNHEDLVAKGGTLIHGSIANPSRAHGTSVLGEICAVDNTVGCVGITPGVQTVVGASTNGSSVANAILACVSHLTNVVRDSGVILIEQQWVNWEDNWPLMIVEVAADVFDAIRLATQLGHLVVEAAGNGGHDLDTYRNTSGQAVLTRGSAAFRDSGALVVGAATSAAPHSRLNFSNHGSRIDCYGWGHNVNTTSSDQNGAINQYTTGFNGTSSASPIVTGAALAVQGMKRAGADKTPINPATLRAILSDPNFGTRSANPATDRVGSMPDLRRIAIAFLNVAPEIYIRDVVGDVGEPHGGISSASPDIIMRNALVGNPQAAFGEGSTTENNVNLSDTVEFGSDNFGYVRLRNRAGVIGDSAVVTLYWSPPATLITPRLWNRIGSRTIDVPPGDELTVAGPFVWPAASVPGPGHYCFIATVSHMLDLGPILATIDPIQNFSAFIQANNNVAWRNFNVADIRPSGPSESSALPFFVPNPEPGPFLDMQVLVRAGLPPGSSLFLAMPDTVQPTRGLHDIPGREPGTIEVELNPNGETEPFETQVLPPMTWMTLHARVPFKYWDGEGFEVSASQFYRKQEVGRVTWWLTVPRKDG